VNGALERPTAILPHGLAARSATGDPRWVIVGRTEHIAVIADDLEPGLRGERPGEGALARIEPIAWEVHDLERALTRLAALGIEPHTPPHRSGTRTIDLDRSRQERQHYAPVRRGRRGLGSGRGA
jgi:hypothetical protein